MALQTKTLTANGAKGHHKFTLTVTEDSTSLANNTSELSWSFVISPIVKEYDWVSNQGKVQYSVVINDTTYSGAIKTYDGVSTVVINSGVQTCAHNSDGTESVSCSFSITDNTGWSFAPGNASASGTMALTKIARQANITAAPNFNDEQSPTITYSNPAGNAVSSLQACICNAAGTTIWAPYRDIPKTGTSYTFSLTDAEREALRDATPNSNTMQVKFVIRTVIAGTDYCSEAYKTLTIVNAAPTLDPYIEDVNDDMISLGVNELVRYHSDAYFATGAWAHKGATIASQSVSCGGTIIEAGTGTFTKVTSGIFTFTVVDSRGNTTTQTVEMPFVEYVDLTCSIGSSKPDASGAFTLTAAGMCYKGDLGDAGANTLTVVYRFKERGGVYGGWQAMAVTVADNSYEAVAELSGLNYQTTYVFQCKAQDRVVAAQTDEVAIKSMPVFDWSETDFNFNVQVNMPALTVDGSSLVDFIVDEGTSDIWTYRKWNSGIAECWGTLAITTTITAAWESMFVGNTKMSRVNYPLVFVSKPTEQAILQSGANAVWLFAESGGNGINSAYATAVYNVCRPSQITTAGTYYLSIHALGRWK